MTSAFTLEWDGSRQSRSSLSFIMPQLVEGVWVQAFREQSRAEPG